MTEELSKKICDHMELRNISVLENLKRTADVNRHLKLKICELLTSTLMLLSLYSYGQLQSVVLVPT